MTDQITSRSQDNLRKVKELSQEIGFEGFRLMMDPQKITSPQAVIEDLCRYLQDEKDGRPNTTPVMSLQFEKNKRPQSIIPNM